MINAIIPPINEQTPREIEMPPTKGVLFFIRPIILKTIHAIPKKFPAINNPIVARTAPIIPKI